MPQLDYCNSVFAGLTQLTLELLQRVQNAATRLVFDLRHRDHVSPYLMQLHWLPVWSRVQFKLSTLMHTIHNQRSSSYLSDTVQTVATATTCCGLRSSVTTDYVVLHTLSKFGERSFAYAGPATWNCLPGHIRRQSTPATFRRRLKTFLFAEVFNTT